MFNFLKRNKILILSFISFFIFLTSLSSPAYAWKLKTHAYIANIVMDDAKDGKVWIPPYGEFEVRPEVAEAIKLYPEFFRGGSMGPDGFPDFWTGQAKIHPNTNPWLQLLWYSLPPYNALPLPVPQGVHYGYLSSDNPKRQAWAFTFGYFSHAAGDMWAHDWVNVYAGGFFPGVSEITADPTHKLPIVTKHIAIETTLDKRIPLSTSNIDIPNDYVINTMILNQQAIALGMNPIASYFATKYFEKLPHKNETTGGTGSGGISIGGYNINVGSGMTAPVLTYDALWFNDLENGFKSTSTQNPGWMEANKRAIKDVMEKNSGMIGSLSSYLGMWSLTYFFDMLGFPSVTRYVGNGVAKNQAQIESALNAIGLGEDQRTQITDDIVNVLIYLTFGMDKTVFDIVWTTEMTQQLFPGNTFAEIMADVGMPPSEATWKNAWTDQTTFNYLISSINGPLYNSVITTKIMMLKPSELERLLGGKKLSGLTGEVAILGVLKGIDFSKQFAASDGLGGDWLGYGMTYAQIQSATWRPIFPYVFKPYGPRDMSRHEVWSASLDSNHRWGANYPVTAEGQSGQTTTTTTTTTTTAPLPSIRLKALSSNQPVPNISVEIKRINAVVSLLASGSDGLTPLVEFDPDVSYYFSVKNQDCYADYVSQEYHMPTGASGAQAGWYPINLDPKMPWGGKVKDSQGNPLSGVTVTTSGKTATTDSLGAYNFGQWLPVANVNITFSKSGYATKQLQGTVQACSLTRKLIIPDCTLESSIAKLNITAKKDIGGGINNAAVVIKEGNAQLANLTTNSQGKVTFTNNFNDNNAQSHTLTITVTPTAANFSAQSSSINLRGGEEKNAELVWVTPPVLSNITMSQFNSETIEVVFNSNKVISSAALEYQTPSAQTKTTDWVSGQDLHSNTGTAYGLSIHEAGMPAGIYKIKIKVQDSNGVATETGLTDFTLFGTSADWGFKATPAANNTYVLSWNKYPRAPEFQKYVLGKGNQFPPPPPTTATSYDAAQIRPQQQAAAQPIEITNINTTTKTVSVSKLTDLTLTARSKRGNFLTKPIAPTVVQAQATTTTTTATTTSTQATTSTTTTGTQSHPTQTTTGSGKIRPQ